MPRIAFGVTALVLLALTACDPQPLNLGGLDGGGSTCGKFPPAACSSPIGMVHPYSSVVELQQLMPGRWLWCKSQGNDSQTGQPIRPLPDDAVGFEFSEDGSRWWFLYDDGHGNPTVDTVGLDKHGAINIRLDSPGILGIALTGGPFGDLQFADGAPRWMHFQPHTFASDFVFDDSGCGKPIDPGIGPAASSPDPWPGGSCDINSLQPTECPAVRGVSCSVCSVDAKVWSCVRPCNPAKPDCPGGQTCQALSVAACQAGTSCAYSIAGNCAGFGGVCR
jgi:hypothetical protein